MAVYDDTDAEAVQNFGEFNLGSAIYYTMIEAATSEQAARVQAMGNASTNAPNMIGKLKLKFNRTRQASYHHRADRDYLGCHCIGRLKLDTGAYPYTRKFRRLHTINHKVKPFVSVVVSSKRRTALKGGPQGR